MTLSDAISLAQSRGWESRAQAHQPPKPDDHFGAHDDYAAYFARKGPAISTWQGPKVTHEYLLLVSYGGVFVEAVYESYLAPKLTRRPKGVAVYAKRGQEVDPFSDQHYKGFVPVRATLVRSHDDIAAL